MNTKKLTNFIENKYNSYDYIYFLTSSNQLILYYYDKSIRCKIINFSMNEKIYIEMINILLKDKTDNFKDFKKELKSVVIPYILKDYITVEQNKKNKFIELIS